MELSFDVTLTLEKVDEDLCKKIACLNETADWKTEYDSLLALRLFTLPCFLKTMAPMIEYVFEALTLLEASPEMNSMDELSADLMQMIMDDFGTIPVRKLTQVLNRLMTHFESEGKSHAQYEDIKIFAEETMEDLPSAIFECPRDC